MGIAPQFVPGPLGSGAMWMLAAGVAVALALRAIGRGGRGRRVTGPVSRRAAGDSGPEAAAAVAVRPGRKGLMTGADCAIATIPGEPPGDEEARARMAAIVESSQDAICAESPEGIITSWNRGAQKLFGRSAAEAVGSPADLLVPAERRAEQEEIRESVRDGISVVGRDTERLHRDGRLLAVSLTVSPLRDAVGRFAGAATIARDITARRRAERVRDAQHRAARALADRENPAAAFAALLAAIGGALGFAGGAAWLVEEEALRVAAIWPGTGGAPERFLSALRDRSFGKGESLPGKVWQRGEPVWIVNPGAMTGNSLLEAMGDAGLRCALAAPLRAGEGVLGVLALFGAHPVREDPELLQAAAEIGEQAGGFLRRHRAEESLRRSAQKLSLHVAHTPLAVVEWGPGLEVAEWNPAAETLFGYRRCEALYRPLAGLIVPENSRAQLRQMWRELSEGTGGRKLTLVTTTRDGGTLLSEWNNTPLIGADGTVTGAASLIQDVTERRRKEETLRRSAVRYHAVIDNLPEVVFQADERGFLLFLNPAWVEASGQAIETSLGKRFVDFLHSDDREPVSERLSRLARRAVPEAESEARLLTRDGGHRWVEINLRFAIDPVTAATGISGRLVDIHRRKLSELLEKDRNRVLEMMAKNRSLTEILVQLTALVERQRPGLRCGILLRRHNRAYHAAAPTLPGEFIRALDRKTLMSRKDFFVIAAGSGERIVISDIASDPRWRLHRELAMTHGLRACWSVPLLTGDGRPLGGFVMYSAESRMPEAGELELLETAGRLAGLAIEQRQLADQISFQAQHDTLTGLPNRILLEDRLQQALLQARRTGRQLAVMFIDLDRFKEINDTLGHAAGDQLLRQVTRRLDSHIRQSDTLARMGGDEFTLVAGELKDAADATRIAQALIDSLALPFRVNGHELYASCSIGISVYPRDGEDAATLQRNADIAMYRAKARGKHEYQCYAPEMNEAAVARMEIEALLRRAADLGRVEMHYQPLFAIGGESAGFEALMRLRDADGSLLPPGRFIPVAEESGLILGLGAWALDEVCRQNAAWQAAGHPRFPVSVNVSALQFNRADFVERVAHTLKRRGLEPRWLELELTESVLMRDIPDAEAKLTRLRSLGVRIAIDDFGTGYSSLAYLQRLPIDRLKIDHAFVRDLGGREERSRRARALVQTIVTLGRSLGTEVVAEGVETAAELEVLRGMGCQFAQGYFFTAALPAAEAEKHFPAAGSADEGASPNGGRAPIGPLPASEGAA